MLAIVFMPLRILYCYIVRAYVDVMLILIVLICFIFRIGMEEDFYENRSTIITCPASLALYFTCYP